MIDGEQALKTAIFEAAKTWPDQELRRQVLEMLAQFEIRRRFVPQTSFSQAKPAICHDTACNLAFQIADPRAVKMTVGILKCADCQALPCLVAPGHYFSSGFQKSRRLPTEGAIFYPYGHWKRTSFENEMLRPLFRYAKQIQLIDRQIGQSMRNTATGALALSKRYEQTIEWLIGQFLSTTLNTRSRTIKITCGIGGGFRDEQERREAASILQDWAKDMSVSFDCDVEMRIKRETNASRKVPHDRFLFTDQIALVIGPGFDLLQPDDVLRDFTLGYLANPHDVVREVDRLHDIR